MATDENILVEMLERICNPAKENIDNFAVQMFCMIVQSNSDLVGKAHQIVIKKIHSNNVTEAARAIGLLEECMSKGGPEFQKKTAKFSFLNELIALVLDRTSGAPAPVETKKRIMECLMLWSIEHPDKSKILEAYNNLKKQVNFENDTATVSSHSSALPNVREHHSSILGKDDQLVAKLLKQGGAESYKKANLLIQKRVNQEARRTEFISHLKNELMKIESTMEVLDEMLNSYESGPCEADNREIILELYNSCKGHNEQMSRWPDFLGDAEPEFLEDVLNTKELLMVILQRYKEIFENEKQCPVPLNLNTSTTNIDLLSDLLGDTVTISSQEVPPPQPKSPKKTNTTLDELSDIFSSIIANDDVKKTQHPSDLLTDVNLLEPTTVSNTSIKNDPVTVPSPIAIGNGKGEKKTQGYMELKGIDELSKEMFKQSLNPEQRLLSFKKESDKLTLNDIAKDKTQSSLMAEKEAKYVLKTNEENKKMSPLKEFPCDFEDLKENRQECLIENGTQEKGTHDVEVESNCKNTKSITLKPLAEIYIDLDEVTPLDKGQRLLLDDDDIQVTLYFTSDRPSEHVSVIVMTVTNKSKLPINDFQFEASVKKPCKVRLLLPTDVAMPPSKPFRPPTPINQVILLLNATQKPVDINCIISYKLGDDPDPIKELVVSKDVPYV